MRRLKFQSLRTVNPKIDFAASCSDAPSLSARKFAVNRCKGGKTMGIALTLQEYLNDSHIAYEVTSHKETDCSAKTAEVSHVPADQLA
jgi:hypothetical protein